MPVYDYRCAGCGDFSRLRPLALRALPAECPACGAGSPRVFIAAPMAATASAAQRAAGAAHERSASEPMNLSAWRSTHRSGCGCCGGRSSSGQGSAGRRGSGTASQAPNGMRSLVGRRPWQISH